MKPILVGSMAVAIAAVAAGFGYFLATGSGSVDAGRALYADNCASCHGVNLEGQPDWKVRLPSGRLPAPPHDETGHTWHHSDRQLFALVKFGPAALSPGYDSDMPAYEGVLTDAEIGAVLAYIRSTWPEPAQAYQADRSRADPS